MVTSLSTEETKTFAASVLADISTQKNTQKATILALSGELGAGKTAFVKSIASLLGIEEEITSPTFVIEKIYRLNENAPFKLLIHIDAYRLEKGEELVKIGWNEIIGDPHNLICIEWPEKVAEIIPPDAHKLKFTFVNETTRTIEKQ